MMVDPKKIEEIIRDHFYKGPLAGSTARLTKAISDYLAGRDTKPAAAPPGNEARNAAVFRLAYAAQLGVALVDHDNQVALTNADLKILHAMIATHDNTALVIRDAEALLAAAFPK